MATQHITSILDHFNEYATAESHPEEVDIGLAFLRVQSKSSESNRNFGHPLASEKIRLDISLDGVTSLETPFFTPNGQGAVSLKGVVLRLSGSTELVVVDMYGEHKKLGSIFLDVAELFEQYGESFKLSSTHSVLSDESDDPGMELVLLTIPTNGRRHLEQDLERYKQTYEMVESRPDDSLLELLVQMARPQPLDSGKLLIWHDRASRVADPGVKIPLLAFLSHFVRVLNPGMGGLAVLCWHLERAMIETLAFLDYMECKRFVDIAMKLSSDDPVKYPLLSALSRRIWRLRKETKCGDLPSLINLLEQAEQLGHSRSASQYNDLLPEVYPEIVDFLSEAHDFQCSQSGRIEDVDRAIATFNRVLNAPARAINKTRILLVLGRRLLLRAEMLKEAKDSKSAEEVIYEARDRTSPNDPLHPLVSLHLLILQGYHWSLRGDLDVLDEVIASHQAMLLDDRLDSITSDSRALVTSQLAAYLYQRFTSRDYSTPADLDQSIALFEGSGSIKDQDHGFFSTFGLALLMRCITGHGEREDIDKAIGILDRAASVVPEDISHGVFTRTSLAIAHSFKCIADPQCTADALTAIEMFSRMASSKTVLPLERLQSAMSWDNLVIRHREHLADDMSHDHVSSRMSALKIAMGVLSNVVWLGLPIDGRRSVLASAFSPQHKWETSADSSEDNSSMSLKDVPSYAAEFALNCDETTTAVEWLEQGRSVVWNQLLQLRMPFDALKTVDPTLATLLTGYGRQLSLSATRDTFSAPLDVMGQNKEAILEFEAQNHRKLVHDWEAGLERARAIPGFEHFLLPKTLSELSLAASNGPVVIVSVGNVRSDALAVLPDGGGDVIHIPLSEFTAKDALEMRTLLRSSTGGRRVRKEHIDGHRQRAGGPVGFDEVDEFEEVLSDLWYHVVKPILDGIAFFLPAEVTQRIHWCPTGDLTFLPLHAAGDYTKTGKGHRVFDYVISSYTPSLGALIPSNLTAESTGKTEGKHLLAIAITDTLPGTKREISAIEKCLTGTNIKLEKLVDGDATAASVLERMKNANWVHFCCHGTQNLDSPTESALLLTGGERLMLSDIIRVVLPKAELAFLSACQTATGDSALPAESLHLAAGMMLAGFKSVVATMWSINDRDAPKVAEDVYGRLVEQMGEGRERFDAASALHFAIEILRKQVGEDDYLSWIPFIHIGS